MSEFQADLVILLLTILIIFAGMTVFMFGLVLRALNRPAEFTITTERIEQDQDPADQWKLGEDEYVP